MTNQEIIDVEATPVLPMVVVVYYRLDTGWISQVAQLPPEVDPSTLLMDGFAFMQGDTQHLTSADQWRVDVSEPEHRLVPKEGTPAAEGWASVEVTTNTVAEPSKEAITSKVSSLMSLEMRRRTVAPVTVEGITFDADTKAQSNIKNKLTEIEACRKLGRTIPAELLVWRDFHNVTHQFESPEALEQILSHVVAELATRLTMLYVWSWEVKAHCATLENSAQVVAYLTDQGVTGA